jgi:hypothetical protein
MKRDMDLIRRILLAAEAMPDAYVHDLKSPEGYEEHVVAHHIYLLGEAGLMNVADRSHSGSRGPEAMPISITWAGHEFLDDARDPTRWSAAMVIAKKAGGFGLDVMTKILGALAAETAKQFMKHS